MLARYRYAKYIDKIMLVGSKATVWPAPEDTDTDYLILVKRSWFGWRKRALLRQLREDAWNQESYETKYPDTFQSWRSADGETNYIITTSEKFYADFALATHVAKKLNLKNKADRVVLFQAILYGKAA